MSQTTNPSPPDAPVSSALPVQTTDQPLRIDLGCGTVPAPGFVGVDVRAFPGVSVVLDFGGGVGDLQFLAAEDPLAYETYSRSNDSRLTPKPWPWADDSVDEARSSHSLEHLTPAQRVWFANELYRVLKVGAKCTIVVPHWCSPRAYGDLSHKWPPVSEYWPSYLSEEWRRTQAPHNDFYRCNFASPGGYVLHPEIAARNPEYQNWAMKFLKDAAQDYVFTLEKLPRLPPQGGPK